MKSLGELLFDGVEYLLCKMIKPDLEIESVTGLTEEEIDKLIDIYGIKGVILDVDETIRYDYNGITYDNNKWLDMLLTKVKVIVVSNGIDKDIEEELKKKNITYIGFAHKPLKKNFLKACKLLQLETNEVVVIGDDILSDIYGGKRNNMYTIKITKKKK
jgi:hypothetical protein